MIPIRVALFVTTLLGALYALLSLTTTTRGDTLVGIGVAMLGAAGWIICTIVEER